MTNDIKDLTYYMGDKTDEELWDIVREACRDKTPTWRAYEVLRGRYNQIGLREDVANLLLSEIALKTEGYLRR